MRLHIPTALAVLAFYLCIAVPQIPRAADVTLVPGLSADQSGISIRGPIRSDDSGEFYRLAEQTQRASVLLNSPGGDIEAGLSIAAEIASRGFTTLVLDDGGCYSVCAVIWVSGIRRYMSPNAKIGVHAAYRGYVREGGERGLTESGVGNADVGAFLASVVGLNRNAIRYFTTAGPSDILPITPAIAQRLDIDVFIQDGSRVIPPSDRPGPRRITRQVVKYMGMTKYCGFAFAVSPAYFRSHAESLLRNGHAQFGGETFSPLVVEFTDILSADISDIGIMRWCIEAEKSLRSDRLSTGITGPSFDCVKASTLTEIAICSSQDLWALDRAMAGLYFYLRENDSSRASGEFLRSQRAWLKRRNACGSKVTCLIERYTSRLFDFGAYR